MGASILNFDQRDIVKTRRNCVFPCISFTSLWWQPHTYVSSPVAPPPLCPPPAFLTHKVVHNGMTAVSLHWIVLKLKWTDTFLSIKLLPPFPHSFTVPVLADQYITLSLNFRIFWNHFFCILFTFFIKWILCDVWKKANSCNLFEIVSCLCRFSRFKRSASQISRQCWGSVETTKNTNIMNLTF